MPFISRMTSFLRNAFGKDRNDRELDAEVRGYVDLLTDEKMRAGVKPEEARRAARLELGGVEQVKENVREVRAGAWLDSLLQDLRYGARMLRKNPGFTAVAVLTLALGIGANTAIFSLMDSLLFRRLPVQQPDRLLELTSIDRNGDNTEMSLPIFEELARHQQVFSQMSAWFGDQVVNVECNNTLVRAGVWAVDGNYYSELGVSPLLGRFITADDVNLHRGAPAYVAVISFGFWKRQLGGDLSVIGKTLRVESLPFTIVGVARESFSGLSADDPAEVTIPLTAEPPVNGENLDIIYDRKALILDVTGRLKDGVTAEQARAQLETLWPRVQSATVPPDYTPERRHDFFSYHLKVESAATGFSTLRKRFSKPLYLLMGISGLVLLIACINLAGLLLSRATTHNHEVAVRLALGATHWRLAKQLLTESTMLSVIGALLGFGMAQWITRLLSDFVLTQVYIVPARLNVGPDIRILGFTAAMALLAGIFFGLAPAWNLTRHAFATVPRQSPRVVGSTGRFGKVLVCAQVALSLVVLMSAGLLVRSLEKLRSNDPGFRRDDVLLLGLFPKPGGYKNLDNVAYYRGLTDKITSLPGVHSVGISHSVPAMNIEWKVPVSAVSATHQTEAYDADLQMVGPGLFETLGMKLLQGRDFSWSDDDRALHIVILSNSLAQRLFPASSALGRHVNVGPEAQYQNLEVVGIVSDASYWNIRETYSPEVYVPALQGYIQWSELLVRTTTDSRAVAPGIRQAVESMGHEYVTSSRPLSEHIDRSLVQERVTAILSQFFGALALLLASIGLYGIMSFGVTCRTREIGVRIALGAQRQTVLWMILRETLALVLIGIALGVPCAFAVTHLIANRLFGISPNDPGTLVLVVFALLCAGVFAACVPARRAMRVDPMEALRHE
jgi:putative ABC transport system permease protein